MQCSLPDFCGAKPFCHFTLARIGSLGSAYSASPGSFNSIYVLASYLLSIASDQLHFPDKNAAAIFLDILMICKPYWINVYLMTCLLLSVCLFDCADALFWYQE